MAVVTYGHRVEIADPPIARLFFSDTRLSPIWLLIRLYVGYQWVLAGYEKLTSPAWTGDQAGSALTGFVQGALKLSAGAHPSVAGFYATFLQSVVLPYTAIWSWAISLGELAVGIGLILGLFTGVAAFFGGLMNANYLLSGTVSSNPYLFVLATWLVLAWKVAGYIGLDYFVLPALGVPGHPGKVFAHETRSQPVVSSAGH